MGGGLIQHGGGCREPVRLVMVGTRVVQFCNLILKFWHKKNLCPDWIKVLTPIIISSTPTFAQTGGFFIKKNSSSFATINLLAGSLARVLPKPFSCKLLACGRFVTKTQITVFQVLKIPICFFLPLDLCQAVLANPVIVGYMYPVLCLGLYIVWEIIRSLNTLHKLTLNSNPSLNPSHVRTAGPSAGMDTWGCRFFPRTAVLVLSVAWVS